MAAVPVLRGGDVILTGHDPREAAAHAAGEDEETARRFGWWPQRSTEQAVLAAYERWAAQWRDDGPRRAFATRDAASGELVGGCELRIGPAGSGEVSYWTHADQRGRGYAKQSLTLLCDYAASIGITRLEAHVATDNHASRRVAESAGFTDTGTFTEEGEQRIRYVRELSLGSDRAN
jgi:RimJ/RimL family protein N-acetyltransferase